MGTSEIETTCDPFHLKSLLRDGRASTLNRLKVSRHVADLRLISVAILLTVLVLFIISSVIYYLAYRQSLPTISPTLVIGTLTIVLGALAKLYQMGSARLGVVDLFSCEISTICRVVLVTEATSGMICIYSNIPAVPLGFNSEETYSPVFDSNAKELEVLEARVVERVTEFYTYYKAVRDYRRVIASIQKPRESEDDWHNSVRHVVYMLFLMLESARLSVEQLVEYIPEKVQYKVEILLSELVAYRFLLEVCQHDKIFIGRLKLRKPAYDAEIDKIRTDINKYSNESDPDAITWSKIDVLMEEFNVRYDNVKQTFDNITATANTALTAKADAFSI